MTSILNDESLVHKVASISGTELMEPSDEGSFISRRSKRRSRKANRSSMYLDDSEITFQSSRMQYEVELENILGRDETETGSRRRSRSRSRTDSENQVRPVNTMVLNQLLLPPPAPLSRQQNDAMGMSMVSPIQSTSTSVVVHESGGATQKPETASSATAMVVAATDMDLTHAVPIVTEISPEKSEVSLPTIVGKMDQI
jgi:hypothetical protein